MDFWIPDENQDFNLPFHQFLSKPKKNHISHHYIDIESATSLFPFQHNFKKIRNNILKSCVDENGTRCLEMAQGKYMGTLCKWFQLWSRRNVFVLPFSTWSSFQDEEPLSWGCFGQKNMLNLMKVLQPYLGELRWSRRQFKYFDTWNQVVTWWQISQKVPVGCQIWFTMLTSRLLHTDGDWWTDWGFQCIK